MTSISDLPRSPDWETWPRGLVVIPGSRPPSPSQVISPPLKAGYSLPAALDSTHGLLSGKENELVVWAFRGLSVLRGLGERRGGPLLPYCLLFSSDRVVSQCHFYTSMAGYIHARLQFID